MKSMNLLLSTTLALCLAAVLAPNVRAQQGGDRKSAAAQFLATHEDRLQQTTDLARKLFLLAYLAPAALAAGETGKAESYSRELMKLGEQLKSQPGFGPSNYSYATHIGNLVLGRIALTAGDVAGAKERLLAAGRVSGSPTLISFGPDMSLAKALIEKGERGAAIEYFDLCATFWQRQNGRLEQWKAIVTEGGMPDFGANLGYVFNSWQFVREKSSAP